MAFSYLSRLFKQLSRSKWILAYFSLVIIQTILSIPILVKTLINTENVGSSSSTPDATIEGNTIFGESLMYKEFKILYENIFFIFYETWRIWIMIDGIVHLNSLTILASAWFSVFSCVFNVMLVVESRKWVSSGYDPLKVENMRFHIALTAAFSVFTIPVIISAYKTSKIIGWQVYKRIGSSIDLQRMYHRVQWFALMLKIDIFFQVFLLIGVAIISSGELSIFIFSIIMCIIMPFTMILSRIAITRESHWMMHIFNLFQLIMLASVIYFLVGLFQYPADDSWFAGIVYGMASVVCIMATMYLAVNCQINFGKGLKSYVEWYPFQRKKNQNIDGTNQATKVGLLGEKIDERQPIDDDDDEYYTKDKEIESSKFIFNNNKIDDLEDNTLILRASLDQGNNKGYKLNSIDLSNSQRQFNTPYSTTRIPLKPAVTRTSKDLPDYDDITLNDFGSVNSMNLRNSNNNTPNNATTYMTLASYKH